MTDTQTKVNDKYENAVVATKPCAGLNKTGRRHIATLQDRILYLRKKISENGDRDLGYFQQEVSALEWAISQILTANQTER